MEHFITFAVALLTICNPAGALSLFVGMTTDLTDADKRKMAVKATFSIFVVLILVTWAGSHILTAFGITTAGLEVAGGIIIALMGLSMLHDKTSQMTHSKNEQMDVQEKSDIAVVPMAIPIVAGPGAISTIILATQKFPAVMDKVYISVVCAGVSAIILVALYFAAPIGRLLGKSGLSVLTKVMGMILTAIAVQMVASGAKVLL